MVRDSLVEAVTGLPALITVASNRPSAEPSATRAATPRPATSVAQTSATATTFRWVMRSAVNIEKLFITRSPQHLPVIGRGGATEGSWASTGKVGFFGSSPRPPHETLKTRDSNRLTCMARQRPAAPAHDICHEFRGLVGRHDPWTRAHLEGQSSAATPMSSLTSSNGVATLKRGADPVRAGR